MSEPSCGCKVEKVYVKDVPYSVGHELVKCDLCKSAPALQRQRDALLEALRKCRVALTPAVMSGDEDSKEARDYADEILARADGVDKGGMTMRTNYTTQAQVRMGFWESIEGLNRSQELRFKRKTGDFRTDTRCSFVDYVDMLQKSGRISETLASRVTLV